MKILYSICIIMIMVLPVKAMACDLEPWGEKGKATPEKVMTKLLKRGDPEFFGKIKIVNAKKEGEERMVYEVETLKQYGGAPLKSFEAVSSFKTSCALSAKKGDEYLVFLPKGSERPFEINIYDVHYFNVPIADMEAYLDSKAAAEKQ